MMIRVFFAFLFLESVFTSVLDEKKDLIIKIADNNSMKTFREQFDVFVNVTNIGDRAVDNVKLHYIYSQYVTILAVAVDNKMVTQIISPLHISNKMNSIAETVIKFTLILEDPVTPSPGYHVDNVLIDAKWNSDGVAFNTGYDIILLPYVVLGCDMVFDVKNGVLNEEQVSATSYYLSSSPQEFGQNSTGWCAREIDTNQYIEILFPKRVRLTSIKSASRITKVDWISSYQVEYKSDGKWKFYLENGCVKNFTGYKEFEETKFPWFMPPLECDGLRIHPRNFVGGLICSKFQIKGCFISNTDTCINAIGMENGKIPDASITDRFQSNSTPAHGRLNAKVYGWVGNASHEDWLQIDLGSLFKITRVAIQGGYAQPHRVTKFKFCYSNDTDTWTCIETEIGTVSTIFQGPEEGTTTEEISMVTLEQPVIARSFRIEPTEYVTMKVMRTELYGCPLKYLSIKEQLGLQEEVHGRSVLVGKTNRKIVICHRKEKGLNCFYATDNNGSLKWKGAPQHIIKVVGMDDEGNLYMLTSKATYTILLNNTDVWRDISNDFFKRKQSEITFVHSIDVPVILPNVQSESLTWILGNSKEIAVSGRGLHIRETKTSPWKQVITWACCGM